MRPTFDDLAVELLASAENKAAVKIRRPNADSTQQNDSWTMVYILQVCRMWTTPNPSESPLPRNHSQPANLLFSSYPARLQGFDDDDTHPSY